MSEIETPRTWTDPNGRMWELSLIDPNIPAMSIPHDWPRDKLPVKSPHYQILFTDPFIPTNRRGVPYTLDKSLSRLTDQEIAGYWKQLVADYPDFAGGGYGTG